MTISRLFNITGKNILVRLKSDKPSKILSEIDLFPEIYLSAHDRLDLSIDINIIDNLDSTTADSLVCNLNDNKILESVTISKSLLNGKIERDKNNRFNCSFNVQNTNDNIIAAVIRICIAIRLEEEKAFFLHASGVVKNDKLYLFYGQSESGKSTIAEELNGGGEIFSSDRILLKLDDDNNVMAYPTPFGDHNKLFTNPKPKEVTAFFNIEQSNKTIITPMSSIKTIKSLFYESLLLTGRKEVYDELFKITSTVAEQKKCFAMQFTKDNSFWKFIDPTGN